MNIILIRPEELKVLLKKMQEAQNNLNQIFMIMQPTGHFSPGEVLTFIIPSYYGFGKSTYQGPLSQNQPVEVNTYFGQMPFVDVAMYMGVIVFFLALFAMFTDWKNPLVRFFTILSVIALLISLEEHSRCFMI